MASIVRAQAQGWRPARWLGALLVVLLLNPTLGTSPVTAGPAALAVDLAGLQQKAQALRRIQLVQAGDPTRLARFEVRLSRLEEELRRLTGRIEQLEFGQRELNGRFDQLVGDLDRRLSGLEGAASTAPVTRPAGAAAGTASAAPLSPARLPPPRPPTPKPRPTAEVAAAQVAPTPPPRPGDQTLGRVPESALATLPTRPDPRSVTPPRESAGLPPQAQYDAAMELLRAGDYAGAAGGLELFLELNPDHPLAANAAYWLAETYYVRKDYAAAAATFARNYRTYGKATSKAPDNLLKLGMSLQGLGQTDNACRSYDELAKAFPNAPAHILQALTRERARATCA